MTRKDGIHILINGKYIPLKDVREASIKSGFIDLKEARLNYEQNDTPAIQKSMKNYLVNISPVVFDYVIEGIALIIVVSLIAWAVFESIMATT